MLLSGIESLQVTKYCAKIKIDNAQSIQMFLKLQFKEVMYNYSVGYKYLCLIL